MKRLAAALALSALLWSCGGDKGTDPDDGGGNHGGDPHLTQVGFIPIYRSTCVYVSGSDAYVLGDSGLYVIDVSDPAHPTRRSFLRISRADTLNNLPEDIYVDGTTAYAAYYRLGMMVFDVTDPDNPDSLSGWASGDAQCMAIQAAQGYAYLAYVDSGLVVLNVGNPLNPVISGRLRVAAKDVSLMGSTLSAMCLGDTLLRVYNVASPGNLSATCSVPKGAGVAVPQGLAVSPSVTAIALDDWNDWPGHGLEVIGPGCGASATQTTPGYSQIVAVSGAYVFVGDYFSRIRVYKHTSGQAPALIDSSASLAPSDLFATGNYLYVVTQQSGLGQGLYVFRFATQ